VDHGRALRPVHDDQFQEIPGSIGPEDEEAIRIFADLFYDHGGSKSMFHVLLIDAMTQRRSEDLHREIVLRNWPWQRAEVQEVTPGKTGGV